MGEMEGKVTRSRRLSDHPKQATSSYPGANYSPAPREFSTDNLTEYMCPYLPCKKSFRKKQLLDSHVQYFHTAKPTPSTKPPPQKPSAVKKQRSSCSISSSEGGSVHKEQHAKVDSPSL